MLEKAKVTVETQPDKRRKKEKKKKAQWGKEAKKANRKSDANKEWGEMPL